MRPIHPLDGLLFETRPRVSGWRLSLEVEGFSWVAIQLGVGQGSVGWQSSLEVEVFSWVEMATQAAGLCLLLAIALSSPVEQGIILGSVINMDGSLPWNSQRRDDTRYLLQEHRWGLERLTSVWFPGRLCQSWKPSTLSTR